MRTPSVPAMPDFDEIADGFDRFLPQIHPVTLALLDHLIPPIAGELVLDVACGTGEPGLTLARRAPEIQLIGVDRAAAMIAIAQKKAAREALTNTRFEVMPSEQIALADGSVDRVVSRFGLLMFGDVPTSARELARVLRPRGHFSLAVWDDMVKNTLMYTANRVLRGYLEEPHANPLEALSAWAADGARTRLLEEVGLGRVDSEMFSWTYRFDSFEEPWRLVSTMGSFTGQASLSPEVNQKVKLDLEAALSAYRQPSGAYVIPHACRLIWGQR